MENVQLADFVATHRDEIIRRCRVKVARRAAPPSTPAELVHGVPLFLDQLIAELRDGPSKTHEIARGAVVHGRDLLRQGFTVSQVVHDYGDVCQSVTDLAVEQRAPIGAGDFRTLNRCLDDAIAGAVTEHARGEQQTRDGDSRELRTLIDTATAAFEALQTGKVGFTGTTGSLMRQCLVDMRAFVDRLPTAS